MYLCHTYIKPLLCKHGNWLLGCFGILFYSFSSTIILVILSYCLWCILVYGIFYIILSEFFKGSATMFGWSRCHRNYWDFGSRQFPLHPTLFLWGFSIRVLKNNFLFKKKIFMQINSVPLSRQTFLAYLLYCLSITAKKLTIMCDTSLSIKKNIYTDGKSHLKLS